MNQQTPRSSSSESQEQAKAPAVRRKKFRRLWQILGGIVGVIVVLVAWVYFDTLANHPDPSVDYLAQINAPILATPEADRAWPLYRAAMIRYNVADMSKAVGYDDKGDPIQPGDQAWPAVVAQMKKLHGLIEALRKASDKSILGLEMKYQYDGDDALALYGGPAPKPDSAEGFGNKQAGWHDTAMTVSAPNLKRFRTLGKLLWTDSRIAMERKDWPSVLADARTLANLGRQLEQQPNAKDADVLIGLTLASVALGTTDTLLHAHDGELTDDQLTQLTTWLEFFYKLETFNLDGAWLVTLDWYQNIYGINGRLSFDGVQLLTEQNDHVPPSLRAFVIMGIKSTDHNKVLSFLAKLAMPCFAYTTLSHQQAIEKSRQLRQLDQQYIRQPFWVQIHTSPPGEKQFRSWTSTPSGLRRYWVTNSLWSVPTQIISSTIQRNLGYRDAQRVAIAIEQFRRTHHALPDILAELTPTYIATLPVDRSTGKPLLYKIVDNHPLIYGRGFDGDDNGGRPPENKNALAAKDGDWILYPQPADD